MERAVDWLFSHPDETGEDAPAPTVSVVYDQQPAVYELFAFISHRGTSAHCGHYVAHIKKGSDWVLFNDNKVVKVPDVTKHTGEGYIYFYKRK